MHKQCTRLFSPPMHKSLGARLDGVMHVKGICWTVCWHEGKIALEQPHKAVLWMVLICMMSDDFLLHFFIHAVLLGDILYVLCVFEVWFFAFLCDLNLARSRSQLFVLFTTSQGKFVKAMVSTSVCG